MNLLTYLVVGLPASLVAVALLGLAYLKYIHETKLVRYEDGRVVPRLPSSLPFGGISYMNRFPGLSDGALHFYRETGAEMFQFHGLHDLFLFVTTQAGAEAVYKNKALNGRRESAFMRFMFDRKGIVFAAPGPQWKAHRGVALRGVMRPSYLKEAVETHVVAVALEMFQSWRSTAVKGTATVDAVASMTALTLEVVGLTAFSKKFGQFAGTSPAAAAAVADANEVAAMAHVRADIGTITGALVKYSLAPPVWLVYETPEFKAVVAAKDRFDAYTVRCIRERQAQATNAKGEYEAVYHDFLDMLLAARTDPRENAADFDDNNCCHTIRDLMAAGTETTAYTLSWALFLVATNPRVQDKLFAQLQAAWPDKDLLPTVADLEAVPYVEAVFRETLRMRPTVPLNLRKATEDTTLLGAHVPAGTHVLISPWVQGQDEAVFAEPNTFKPERFEAGSDPVPTYPFGLGARQCIGMRLAELEAQMVIALVCRRYVLAFEGDPASVGCDGSLTLRPVPGVRLTVTERTA